MIVQDVIALPTFNPHGGPTTHSSTGSKSDSPVHPLLPNLFIARGLVCNSRTTVLLIYSGIRRNTYSRCLNPLSHFVSGNERFTRSKLLMVPTYFALDIVLNFHSRVTFRHLPRCYQPDSQPFRGLLFRSYPLSFVSTMEFPKKGCQLHHDDLEQEK